MHALVAEAMKKAAIIWVSTADDQPAYPLWCASFGDALCVVINSGDVNRAPTSSTAVAVNSEQPAPGLADASIATVVARGDHGGRIVTWRVDVQAVIPGSDDWNTVAPSLAAKRLNVPGSTEDLVADWLKSAKIMRLAPTDEDIIPSPDDSAAAPVRPTPAANRTSKPFRLHRVKRR